MKIKGVIDPSTTSGKRFDNPKDEMEHELAVGSNFLQENLNYEEVETLNKYIWEKERIVELHLDPATINYRECLVDTFKGVEDPFSTEIGDLNYDQNPTDPSQVIRNIVFKHGGSGDTSS